MQCTPRWPNARQAAPWDREERLGFLRGFGIAAAVCVGSFVGVHLLAVPLGWTYGLASNVMPVPFGVWVLLRFVLKPRKELWD